MTFVGIMKVYKHVRCMCNYIVLQLSHKITLYTMYFTGIDNIR